MPLNLRDLAAKLIIRTDKKAAADAEKDVAGVGDRMVSTFKRVGAAIAAAFTLRAIVNFGKAAIAEASAAEKAWKGLASTVEGVGVKFKAVEAQLRLISKAFADATVHGDDDFAVTLQRLIALTDDYDNSLKNVGLVANVAAKFFDGDLAPAADLVGQAMNGVTRGLKAVGIVTTDAAAGLRLLAHRTMGEAEARTKTFAGQVQKLGNEWGEFKEAIGNALIEAGSEATILETLTATVKTMTGWVEANGVALKSFASDLLAVGRAASSAARDLMNFFKPAEAAAGAEIGSITTRDPKALAARLRIEEENFKRVAAAASALRTEQQRLAASMPNAAEIEKEGGSWDQAYAAWSEAVRKIRTELFDLDDKVRTSTEVIAFLKRTIAAPPAKTPGTGDLFGGAGSSQDRRKPRIGPRPLGQLSGDADVPWGMDPTLMAMPGLDQQLEMPDDIVDQGKEDAFRKAEERLDRLRSVGVNAAMGIAGSFQDAFGLMIEGFDNVGRAAEAMGRGITGALLGGVAEYASSKMKTEAIEAIEATAFALGLTSVGKWDSASAAWSSAATHAAAAVAWGALAGGGGSAQTAVAGGSRGGRSGGIPSGASDGIGRTLENPGAQVTIHNHFEPFNPRNPVHVRTGATIVKSAGRMDSSIDTRRKGR